MPKKSLSVLLVIMMLAASALACNTVMGGSPVNTDDLQATADALSSDPDAQATIAAAEATAAALGVDLNGNGDDSNSNDNTGDDSNSNDSNGNTDNPFGQGPADIPVENTNAELVFADDSSLTYYTDASTDDTADFYRTEMVNAGWELAPNGDNVLGPLTSLQFNKDGKQALIAITTDPTSNRTLVTITVTG